MKPPFPYYGGKHLMMKYIMPLQLYPRGYCEPFLGSGGVLFARRPAKTEVAGDTMDVIVNFYEVVKDKNLSEMLQVLIDSTLCSESQFNKAKKWLKTETGPVRRAWAFWMTCCQSIGCSHGGWKLPNKSHFTEGSKRSGSHVTHNNSNKFDIKKYAKRLENVMIFCRNALEVIQRCDTPETYFYLDPPYPGSDQGHYKGYRMDDFMQLLELLQQLKGKFLLSSGDYPALDEITKKMGWSQQKVEMQSTAGPKAKKKRQEVLTWNYTVQKKLF